jgi:hypothetical protein
MGCTNIFFFSSFFLDFSNAHANLSSLARHSFHHQAQFSSAAAGGQLLQNVLKNMSTD